MKLRETGPQFVTIRWEGGYDTGRAITLEATLCKLHRQEIAREFPGAHGCMQLGASCDFCEGRKPKTV